MFSCSRFSAHLHTTQVVLGLPDLFLRFLSLVTAYHDKELSVYAHPLAASRPGSLFVDFPVPGGLVAAVAAASAAGAGAASAMVMLTQNVAPTLVAWGIGREDINSVLMTVMQSLLEKYGIDPAKIGRLEVRNIWGRRDGCRCRENIRSTVRSYEEKLGCA